jgi:hypothetical protein
MVWIYNSADFFKLFLTGNSGEEFTKISNRVKANLGSFSSMIYVAYQVAKRFEEMVNF